LSDFSAILRHQKTQAKQAVWLFRPVNNGPAASEHVPRGHANGDLPSISRSRNCIGKEELFWGLPGSSTLAIDGCASLFDLPNFPNGANPPAHKAPLIPIEPICKSAGNRDATRRVNYGRNCKNAGFLGAG